VDLGATSRYKGFLPLTWKAGRPPHGRLCALCWRTKIGGGSVRRVDLHPFPKRCVCGWAGHWTYDCENCSILRGESLVRSRLTAGLVRVGLPPSGAAPGGGTELGSVHRGAARSWRLFSCVSPCIREGSQDAATRQSGPPHLGAGRQGRPH
jgi:hypothetical protein